MKCNVAKMRAARDRRAMTQEKLAAEAKIDIRTVQRAEAGASLRQETIADIAAVLGLPLTGLIDNSSSSSEDNVVVGVIFGTGLTLKRAISAREVIELMEETRLGKLECDADPSDEIMDMLTEAILFIEKMLPKPWSEEERNGPLVFDSLVDRLQHISKMKTILANLDRQGLGLFTGSSWINAIMPLWSDEGLYTRTNQPSESVRATRLLISSISADRVTVQLATNWGVDVVDVSEPFGDDLDEDVPF